jgi:hypothetical protein
MGFQSMGIVGCVGAGLKCRGFIKSVKRKAASLSIPDWYGCGMIAGRP